MKTIKRSGLGPIKSSLAPGKVINTDGHVYEYIGFGWIKLGKATDEDKENYPQIID